MRPAINIVVTCTKRKTRPVLPELMVRSLPSGTVEERAGKWIDRLCSAATDRVLVEMLYAGDYWSVVRSLAPAATCGGYRARIWVCSAGYGLLSLTSKVGAYSATFSLNHPDSVCRNLQGTHACQAPPAWWRLLSRWEGPEPGTPRNLTQLAGAHPRSVLWVIASEVYLHALAEDLGQAVRCLADPDRLCIFSAGTQALPGLAEHLVPCDARLQPLVGGARRSLNVRTAREALRELRKGSPGLSALRGKFSALLERQPPAPSYNRTPMSDDDVKRYIRTALAEDPTERHTPLLRRLRDSGRACEHRRFASLFYEVREQINDR